MPEPGVPWHPQFMADQLTLFQPGGKILSTLYYWHPQMFSPSGIPVSCNESALKIGIWLVICEAVFSKKAMYCVTDAF